MNDQLLIERLRSYDDDEPQSHLDPTAIVAAGRRRQLRRRGSAAAGVSALAVAAVVAASMLFAPGDPAPQPATAGPSAPVSAKTISVLQQEGALIRAELQRVLPTILRGVTEIEVGPIGQESDVIDTTNNYLTASVRFTDPAGPAVLEIQVNGPQVIDEADAICPADNADSTALQCQVSTGSSGLLMTTVEQGPSGQCRLLSVVNFRPDGVVVSASAYNYDPADPSMAGQSPSCTPSRPSYSATADQLEQLVTNPLLTLS